MPKVVLDDLLGALFWVLAFSIVSFVQMGADKRRAICGRRRISGSALFSMAVAGGSPGALLGMLVFHHKTKKPKFCIGIPLVLLAQAALLAARLWWLAR